MRLISWNVNGIRAISKKGFLEWFVRESPDILCLQETKCHPDQLTDQLLNIEPYHSFWSAAERKGYSGVVIYTRQKPQEVIEGLGVEKFDHEGRTLIAVYDDFILYNIYYPNGGSGNKRVPFKISFYDAFLKHVNKHKKQGKNIIICGDFNTAHTEMDLARPKANVKNTGFLPEERAWISAFVKNGYVDTFRHLTPDGGHYTWWDYKTRARERDVGWRLDYFFISQNFLPFLKKAFIMKMVLGSDHCPVGIDLQTP